MSITHVNIPTELFVLPLTGTYEMSVVALAYSFNDKGLMISNVKLARAMKTSNRTIERVISRLRKNGFIENTGTGNNDRCLRLTTDTMSLIHTDIMSSDTDTLSGQIPTSGVVTTDTTADHNKVIKKNIIEEGIAFVEFENHWNLHRNLPRIRAFTDSRKRQLNTRSKEPEFAKNWKQIINKLASSSFHTGQNKSNWRATADWLLKDDNNYIKILELDDTQDNVTREVSEDEAAELMAEVASDS